MPVKPVMLIVKPPNPETSAYRKSLAKYMGYEPLTLSLSKGLHRTEPVGFTRDLPWRQRSTHQLVTNVRSPAPSGNAAELVGTSCGITK
jgi:hypothetical protein